jgi:glycosyltransferase involved in cell wall biosynthesis
VPRVTVITPAYNSAEELPEALQSVQAQTSDDWEVVVCDDASTDDTAAIAESFGTRVRVIRNERNLGPAGARNRALEAARGELIALLDADDYWLPEYLEEQIAFYEKCEAEEPGVGVVTCDALIVGPRGPIGGTFRDRVPFPSRPTLAKLLVQNTIYGSSLLPRAIAEEVGGFSPECRGTEDHDLWVKVLERGYRPVANPKAVAVYRLREGSLSSNPLGMARNWQTVERLALKRGRLGWWESRIAHRELRYYRLLEDLAEIRSERASGRSPGAGRVLRAARRAAVVALENPMRWIRLFGRLIGGKGSLKQRLIPGREDVLAEDGAGGDPAGTPPG